MLQKRLTGRVGMLAAAAVVASLAVPLATVPAGSRPAAATLHRPPHRAADRGTWRVTRVDKAPGEWPGARRSRSPSPRTARASSRAGRSWRLTIIGSDGRTVEVTVRSDVAPDPADLDVVLSGDRLDVVGSDLRPAVHAPR